MAILTREQYQDCIKKLIGDDTSDDAIKLVEDMTSTFDDLSTKAADTTNWEQKYNENDKAWRQKYRDAFFSPIPKQEEKINPEDFGEAPTAKSFEELFTEK